MMYIVLNVRVFDIRELFCTASLKQAIITITQWCGCRVVYSA